jgi:predicted O-methyltransferase YrrM
MSTTNTAEILHERFSPHSDQTSPVRIKGYTRQNLAQLFAGLGFVRGAEIGVAEGIYSEVLCQNIPNLKLLCVDLWSRYAKKGNSDQERCFAITQRRLAPYPVEYIRKPSMDALADVQDGSLDFVYIDADHRFDFVMRDVIEWSKKVRPGGIVAGHDYYHFKKSGVVEAVDAYTFAHQIHEWFIDDQREPSFFWVKP